MLIIFNDNDVIDMIYFRNSHAETGMVKNMNNTM